MSFLLLPKFRKWNPLRRRRRQRKKGTTLLCREENGDAELHFGLKQLYVSASKVPAQPVQEEQGELEDDGALRAPGPAIEGGELLKPGDAHSNEAEQCLFSESPTQSARSSGYEDEHTETAVLSSLRDLTPDEAQLLGLPSRGGKELVWQMPTGEAVSYYDLDLLVSGRWLNDEIINAYFALLKARSDRSLAAGASQLRVYCFNSFFYSLYESSGYMRVRRWTKLTDLFSFDLVLFPVNLNNSHWALAAVNIPGRRIEYYDSLMSSTGRGKAIMNSLCDYLQHEAADKGKPPYAACQMQRQIMSVPQQMDGASCGVFICAYADFLARGISPPFSFTHDDIVKLKRGMAVDILLGYLPS